MSRCHLRLSCWTVRTAVAVLTAACPELLRGQTEPDRAQDGRWHYRVAPYLWASGIDGTASMLGVFAVPLEASFSDVMSNLDIGLASAIEARRDRLGIALDFNYINLGADVLADQPLLVGELDLRADVRQLTAEGFGFYRVVTGGRDQAGHLDLLAGLRYTSTRTRLTGTGLGGDDLEGTRESLDWLDGMAGARFRLPLGSRVGLTGRGDIAGFGSNLTWNARAGLDVALGRRFATGAEYRWLDVDYDSGERLDRRIVELRYAGPLVWVAYSW